MTVSLGGEAAAAGPSGGQEGASRDRGTQISSDMAEAIARSQEQLKRIEDGTLYVNMENVSPINRDLPAFTASAEEGIKKAKSAEKANDLMIKFHARFITHYRPASNEPRNLDDISILLNASARLFRTLEYIEGKYPGVWNYETTRDLLRSDRDSLVSAYRKEELRKRGALY